MEIHELTPGQEVVVYYVGTVEELSVPNFEKPKAKIRLEDNTSIHISDTNYFDLLDSEDSEKVPDHYSGQTDVIEFTKQQFTQDEWIASMKFNIIKYATRLGRKDALDKELDKIIDYAQRLKEGLAHE